jgi:Protein of unknown function (DUF1569)
MHPDLARCRAQIEQEVAGLDDASGSVRHEGRWSIAEIVEHLDRTYTGTTKGLARCLEAGAPRATADSLRRRLARVWVVTLGRFPTGIDAPRHVLPVGELALSALLPGVGQHLEEMDAALSHAAARFGTRAVMDHPILGPFTTADWARFHVVHTRHHCRQIAERRLRAGAR